MSDIAPSFEPIQQESVQFNQPVSESSAGSIGAATNALLRILLPVGSIVESMLTEAQFQAQIPGAPIIPATWVLSDGRSAVGSAYQVITGFTNIPDLRGIITRGKNNGRSGGSGNPDGDLLLGTYSSDKFGAHFHGSILASNGGNLGINGTGGGGNWDDLGARLTVDPMFTSTDGSNETAPRTVTINKFIRIN